MKKRDLVRSTVAVTAMMIISSVGYTVSSPLVDFGVVQEIQAAEVNTENANQEDINVMTSNVVTDSAIESEPTSTPETAVAPTSEPTVLTSSATDVYAQPSNSSEVVKVSKTVTVPCGSIFVFKLLGFDTVDANGNSYTYEYDKYYIGRELLKAQSFEVIVTQINNATGEKVVYTVTVDVKDMTKPTLKGVKKLIKIVGGKNVVARIKKGVSATDNIDGKIAKSKIKVSGYKAKKYGTVQKVTFTVKDKAGNVTKKTVKLKIINPVKKVNKTMYAKSVVNVRKTSTAKGKKLGTLKFGTKVKVIGQDRNTGWYKIKYKGGTGWVNNSYLSSKKPSKPSSKNSSSSKKDNNGKVYDCHSDGSDCYSACDCACDGECVQDPDLFANWECTGFNECDYIFCTE